MIIEARLHAGGSELISAAGLHDASMAPAVNQLIERAKADGHLRHDVERTALFLIDVMVDAARWYTRGVAPEQ